MERILKIHVENKNPGTDQGDDNLKMKDPGGPPKSKRRMEQRREVGASGPTGLLLETLHINAATIDEDKGIKQWDQPPIDI